MRVLVFGVTSLQFVQSLNLTLPVTLTLALTWIMDHSKLPSKQTNKTKEHNTKAINTIVDAGGPTKNKLMNIIRCSSCLRGCRCC